MMATTCCPASWTRSAAHLCSRLEQQGRHLLSRATLNGHKGKFGFFINEICYPYLTVWRDLDRYCDRLEAPQAAAGRAGRRFCGGSNLVPPDGAKHLPKSLIIDS